MVLVRFSCVLLRVHHTFLEKVLLHALSVPAPRHHVGMPYALHGGRIPLFVIFAFLK